jgi:hypothetical protein
LPYPCTQPAYHDYAAHSPLHDRQHAEIQYQRMLAAAAQGTRAGGPFREYKPSPSHHKYYDSPQHQGGYASAEAWSSPARPPPHQGGMRGNSYMERGPGGHHEYAYASAEARRAYEEWVEMNREYGSAPHAATYAEHTADSRRARSECESEERERAESEALCYAQYYRQQQGYLVEPQSCPPYLQNASSHGRNVLHRETMGGSHHRGYPHEAVVGLGRCAVWFPCVCDCVCVCAGEGGWDI